MHSLSPAAGTRRPRRRSSRSAHGFTLISVLVAAVIAAFGVLAIIRLFGTVTAGTTQNENVSQVAALGNGFWGVVQANPGMLDLAAFTAGPFTQSNYTDAPASLQPWLLQATTYLPGASIAISTSNDVGFGSPCSSAAGCSVTLGISWTQVGSANVGALTRTQNFYFQFGL